MRTTEWLLAIAFVLIGLALMPLALSNPSLTPAIAPAVSVLYEAIELTVYAGLHIVVGFLHMYSLLRRRSWRNWILTVEMGMSLFVGFLLFLLTGFSSPNWVYAVFAGLVAGQQRSGRRRERV